MSEAAVPSFVDSQRHPVTAEQAVTASFAEVGMLFVVRVSGSGVCEGSKGKDEQGQLVQHDWSSVVVT